MAGTTIVKKFKEIKEPKHGTMHMVTPPLSSIKLDTSRGVLDASAQLKELDESHAAILQEQFELKRRLRQISIARSGVMALELASKYAAGILMTEEFLREVGELWDTLPQSEPGDIDLATGLRHKSEFREIEDEESSTGG